MSIHLTTSPADLRGLMKAPKPDSSTYTTSELYIIIRSTDPGYAWGSSIQHPGDRAKGFHSGECGSLQELEAAVKKLITRANELADDHELLVSCEGEQMLWRKIALRLPIGVRTTDPVERAGGRILNIVANMSCPATITQAGTVIASDGSVSLCTGHAGYGWIADNGSFGLGMLGVAPDVCHAELAGVQSAMRMVSSRAGATLLVDSTEAISLIRKQLTIGTAHFSTNAARHRRLEQIDRTAIRTVSLEKVAAHSGHILNEGADRLSRLARRGSESGMTEYTLWRTATGIRDEVLGQLAASTSSAPPRITLAKAHK